MLQLYEPAGPIDQMRNDRRNTQRRLHGSDPKLSRSDFVQRSFSKIADQTAAEAMASNFPVRDRHLIIQITGNSSRW